MFPARRWAVLGEARSRALVLDGLKSLVDHDLAESPCLAALSEEPAPAHSESVTPRLLPAHITAGAAPCLYASAEMLWRCDDAPPFDIVADPEPLRAAQGLARGCHVLTDWPESVDLATVRGWRDEAVARGLYLAAVAWPRYSAVLAMLRWSLARGVLGPLRHVTLGAVGGPVELGHVAALVDWLCGPVAALRLVDGRVEARLAGGGQLTTAAESADLCVTGELGRYRAGWLHLAHESATLSRWFGLQADPATRERLFPSRLVDSTGRALHAFLSGLDGAGGGVAEETLRSVLIADALRESSNRRAIWVDVPAGTGD
ncbi:MAG: hypothetical protein HZB16_16100 [Armatimonadetes bacterium]|nr:hypothetical protein [Armatimonadota bacterium]